MQLDRTDAKFVDYLLSVESSHRAVLIEIKTPTTSILRGKYRGYRLPSRDLVGSVMQVKNYGLELVQNLKSISGDKKLEAFSPKLALIVGNGSKELTDPADRHAFDLRADPVVSCLRRARGPSHARDGPFVAAGRSR
jgi:hypothetical protein